MGEKRGTHLVGEAKESAEELGEVHLARGELATATVVGAVEGRDRVDDEEGEAAPRKAGRSTPKPQRMHEGTDRDSAIIAPAWIRSDVWWSAL